MKKFLINKKIWLLALALLMACSWFLLASKDKDIPAGIETGLVERGEVVEVVSETGYVQATRSVDMAFERGGRVVEMPVKAGAVVAAGDLLVQLENAAALADVAAASARLQAEQARLRELLAGADSSSLAVTQSSVASAQTALANAQRNLADVTDQQNQLVTNAQKTLRSSGLQAYLVSSKRENSDYSYQAPTVTGSYFDTQEGNYRLELYSSAAPSGSSYRVSGLGNNTESVSTVSPTPVGDKGLFIQFPDNFAKSTQWEIPVPNTRSASYLTNLNAYNSAVEGRMVAIANAENAVKSAQSALKQAQTQLTQAAGSARTERVSAQRAVVQQMQAALQSAQVQLDNTTLKAPFSGLVTDIYTEVGEIVPATTPVASFISDGKFELTVEISEVDIAHMSISDEATVKFDAYDDAKFKAHVTRIAPRAQLIDGVRVFSVTLEFDEQSELIRDGLSADIDITTAKKEAVIAIPTRAIYEDAAGKFVRVLNGSTVKSVYIKTGLRGSNGQSEVTDGLSGGETIITFADEAALKKLENN